MPRAERRAGAAPPRPRGARPLQLLLKAHVEEGETAEPLIAAAPIQQGPGCSLMELGDDKCRWPIGDACAADLKFCGNLPLGGLPYCAGHARLAYRVGTRRAAG